MSINALTRVMKKNQRINPLGLYLTPGLTQPHPHCSPHFIQMATNALTRVMKNICKGLPLLGRICLLSWHKVGRLHSASISSQLWFNLIYYPPTFNWPWFHPFVWLHSVYYLNQLWTNSTFSPPISRLPWSHPVTIQLLKIHQKTIPLQNSPTQ